MKTYCLVGICLVFLTTSLSLAHDPRSVAKEMGVSLSVEGSGDFKIQYKSLHFNPEAYSRMKSDSATRGRLNKGIWNTIGTAHLGFDIVVGGQKLESGQYNFGLNVESGDGFSLVFGSGNTAKTIPMMVGAGGNTSHLTLSLIPTNAPDTFVLEGRCGSFRGTAEVKVPDLSEDH